MGNAPKTSRILIVLLTCIGAISPLALYRIYVDSTPAIGPQEARAALGSQHGSTLLVDCRTEEEYLGMWGVSESYHWPLQQILSTTSLEGLPTPLQGKTLHILCAVGIRSAVATKHLRSLGHDATFNVRGGLVAWQIVSTKASASPPIDRLHWALKVLVILLGCALLGWRRPRLPPLLLLAGLLACAVNLTWGHDGSEAIAAFHTLAIAAALGLTSCSLLEKSVTSATSRLPLMAVTVCVLVSLGLLLLPCVYPCGLPSRGPIHPADCGNLGQLVEIRHCPIFALVLLALAALLRRRNGAWVPLALVLLATALGHGAAGALRTAGFRMASRASLGSAYGDLLADGIALVVLFFLSRGKKAAGTQ